MSDIEVSLVEQLAEHFTKSFENLTDELKEVVTKNYLDRKKLVNQHWNELSIFQRISKAQEIDNSKTIESSVIHECIFKFFDINKFIEDNYNEALKKDKEGVALILRQLKDEVNLDKFINYMEKCQESLKKNSKDLFIINAETYPVELDFAYKAWLSISTTSGKGKPKARIKDWLDKNNSKLSNEAKERISIVANWDKSGGATRTS